MGLVTVSGAAITDLMRASAKNWLATQQGGTVDEFAYPDGSFGVWEGGTNKFRRGQCDSAVDCQAIIGSTVSVDALTPAPFSPQCFKVVTDGTSPTQGVRHTGNTGEAAAPGTIASTAVWFKGVKGQTYRVISRWLNTDATVTDAVLAGIVATGDWQYAVGPTVTVAVGKTGDAVLNLVTIDGQRAEAFRTAHPMLKGGAPVPGPYVATSQGATAARASAGLQIPASLLNETQAWMALQLKMGGASGAAWGDSLSFLEWWLAATDRIFAKFFAGSLTIVRRAGGVSDTATLTPVWAAGDAVTLIAAWDAASVKGSFNGGAFASAASSHVPNLAGGVVNIGQSGTGIQQMDASLRWLACGKGTLTDADAARIASWGDNPQPRRGWPMASQVSMVWKPYNEFYSDANDYRPSDNDDAKALYSKARMMGYSHQEAYYLANRINP